MTFIPRSPSDISAGWLSEVLGTRVVAVEAANLGEGVGVMGEVTRLTLSYADGAEGPPTLIAKTISPAEQNLDTASTYGFYTREVSFYQQVAQQMDLRVPACRYADMADGGVPFVLLLEEIVGARQIDQLVGPTLDEAERIVDEVAKLHAAWWDNPAIEELTWLPPMNNPLYKGYAEILPQLTPVLEANWGDRLDPTAMPWLHRLCDSYPALLDWYVESGPVTFCHYDLRPDNILIGPASDPDGICLLDWQLAVRHRGTFDMAYFLGQNVPVDFRRTHQEALLRRYHTNLEGLGVTGYSYDRCWDDYRASMLMHVVSATQVQLLDGGNERGQALLDAMLSQGWQAAVDLDAGAFIAEFG